MPVKYSIDVEARLVSIVGSGPLTDEEAVACVAAIRADPLLEPDMNTLSDMRQIEVAFTSRGVTAMIDVMERSADRRANAKAAIVVSRDVAFGMGRMLALMTEDRVDPEFRIFREMDQARAWLGLD